MRLFIFITLLLALLFAAPVQADRHEQNSVQEGLDRRAIVAVRVAGRSGFCSGALVSDNKVLTATHCVYDLVRKKYFSAADIQVGVGENILSDDFSWFPIRAIEADSRVAIRSEGDYLNNDVISLILSEPQSIQPLAIASPSEVVAISELHAWGFGEDEWGYFGIRKSRPLCGALVESGLITFSSGACRGDSGGPVLNALYQVVAVISLSEVRHCVEQGRRIAQRVW
jgi:V8-like Glu-specific endopeptidase